MIRLAITFFILAILAYILGAYGIAGLSMEIARIILFVFLAIAVISFIGAVLGGRTSRHKM